MKVTGPGAPPPPPTDLEEAGGPKAAQKAGKAPAGEFAAKLEPGAASSSEAASRAGGNIASRLANELRQGTLTPEQALARLVEHAVDAKVGADAPAALREQVRAAIEETVAADPLLAERLQRLARRR